MPTTNLTAEERFRFVRSQMVLKKVTNADIARKCGVRSNYVYMVLAGLRTGYRIREAIADAVGRPVHDLWPDHPQRGKAA